MMKIKKTTALVMLGMAVYISILNIFLIEKSLTSGFYYLVWWAAMAVVLGVGQEGSLHESPWEMSEYPLLFNHFSLLLLSISTVLYDLSGDNLLQNRLSGLILIISSIPVVLLINMGALLQEKEEVKNYCRNHPWRFRFSLIMGAVFFLAGSMSLIVGEWPWNLF
ncbi:hypothetical protein FE810_14840 [Thalassotalea litorea]|uniref:Uncharacterized protein n=1 Tax=Thalassotalea litorea TaxID=2020715 RepID=A0A5R9ICI6_9GAMM|nr:hypothetical protein [Thalassotalea litorea]TLU61285.1 hypothetical protein FE810_14840 [Thalassotalea litorea]